MAINKRKSIGLIGVFLNMMFLAFAMVAEKKIDLPVIFFNQNVVNFIFIISILVAVIIFYMSKKTLPHNRRAKSLCDTGIYKYIRHPIYAALVSVFNVGLALYLNNYIYLIWAAFVHLLWHALIAYEESHLVQVFGTDYEKYQLKTWKFFPKIL